MFGSSDTATGADGEEEEEASGDEGEEGNGQTEEEYLLEQQMRLEVEKQAIMANTNIIAEEKTKLLKGIEERAAELKKQEDDMKALRSKIKVRNLMLFLKLDSVGRNESLKVSWGSWFGTVRISLTFAGLTRCSFLGHGKQVADRR